MMLTPLIRRQLKIFTVLSATALGLTVFSYARVPAQVGIGVYDVRAEFDDASGLYPKANVTYRGVKVGQVSAMELSDEGATAVLRLDDDVRVPRGVQAELHTTSAVGEQYVDLVPRSADGPYLEDGDELGPDQTVEMPQISPVLDSLNGLLASVPRKETRAVLGQLNEGLGGSGDDLRDVIDSTGLLVAEAQTRIDATTSLIHALDPVLRTQEDLAPRTLSYADSLADVTQELSARDRDVRGLLREGPPALKTAEGVVEDLHGPLPMMLANLTTSAEVLHTYLPNLEQTLVVYPATVARLQSTVNPRARQGDVQLDLKATFNDPPHCTSGYLAPGSRRSPAEASVRPVDGTAHCRAAAAGPSAIRGARNLPCPDDAGRGALPADCGLRFGRGIWPDGATRATDSQGEDAWMSLVLGPLGLS